MLSLCIFVVCIEMFYIMPLLRCMYTIRNVPSSGMEGLQIFNGKVSQLRTDLGEFQIHDFRIYYFFLLFWAEFKYIKIGVF